MRMRDAHWLALPSLHYVPLLRNMDSGSVRVLLGVRGADGPCHDWLPMIDGRRGFDGVRKDL